ncbi:NEL-type E3 ubiquitin ligase domain-containing protein [Pseudomonas sp. R5(2019)]|uniref:NEL-type E3 ubiquitin ligase domain-containing protein n=1 Tax=Pseudomonas sp. R5(2019) TaxID=2697566 RepID=UPI0014134DC5|nr:NEL-type E3 ubiquitin ligase domain-containing protein [Pseudomonas sp. R5(2019)]NBA95445.1 hypothetical protein [Pseudomonas sp. R5(2019)]
MSEHSGQRSINEYWVRQLLPASLIAAKPALVRRLSHSLKASQQAHDEVLEALKSLQTPDDFAAPLLSASLVSAFGEGLDIHKDQYWHGKKVAVIPEQVPIVTSIWQPRYFKHSLLQAALHNFSAQEAAPIYTLDRIERASSLPLQVAITPERFAAHCRELDLGGRYQAHLEQVFAPEATAAAITRSKRHDLEVAAHMALLLRHISPPVYQLILNIASLKNTASSLWQSVTYKQLLLSGRAMADIVLIECWCAPQHLDDFNLHLPRLYKLVVYIPNDPRAPLREYGTFAAFEQDLIGRLQNERYRQRLCRFVRRDEAFALLNQWQAQAAGQGKVSATFDTRPISAPLFDSLHRLLLERLKQDAGFIAVPSARDDQKAQRATFQDAVSMGLDGLVIASFFVPGLAQLMLGVMVGQLMYEVFAGFVDWASGDRRSAFLRLTVVLEQSAGIAAFGLVAGATAYASQQAGFFERLVPVRLANGKTRLWNPDLTPYQCGEPPALGVAEDEQGLIAQGSSQVIRMDGTAYEVMFDEALGKWRIPHPRRPQAYAPVLEHNGAGAWRASFDSPMHWVGARYLFRRLGPRFWTLPDRAIDQVLQSTGIDEAALREIHLQGDLPPGRLLDALEQLPLDPPVTAAGAAEPGAGERLICRDFPSLPLPVAQQIIDQATDAERERIVEEDRLPLRLGELARVQLQEVRIDRAIAGFNRTSHSNADTETLLAAWRHQATELEGDQRRMAAAWASADRERSAGLLGIIRRRERFNPPQREVDHRLGYALSGRGAPALVRSTQADEVRELFPGMSDRQVADYLQAVQVSGEHISVNLQRRRNEFELLEQTLHQWEVADTGTLVGVWRYFRGGRTQASRMLRRAWRRQTTCFSSNGRVYGYRLNLSGARVTQLPELPALIDFSHVVDLSLNHMRLSQISGNFLNRFSSLIWLDASHNRLSALPAELSALTELRSLNLQDNRIAISTSQAGVVNSLRFLEELNLNGNPVGPHLDLSSLSRLQVLGLRETGISSLPQGLLSSVVLRSADLRNNAIETLPETFFQPERPDRYVVLAGNPLSESTRQRLAGVRDYAAGPSLARPLSGLPARLQALWGSAASSVTGGLQAGQWAGQWASLYAEPGSRDLLRLLLSLERTSDFRLGRLDLTRRVWAVVQAALDSTLLRRELFSLASSPTSCMDSVISMFSRLEVKVLLHEVQVQARTGDDPAGLIGLGRGLFRLEQLERYARHDIDTRSAGGGEYPLDQIEVNLAYRVRLADRLALPGQPRSMEFGAIAGVTAANLEAAVAFVLAAERTPQWLDFLCARDFWIEFLKRRYPARFASLGETDYEALEALELQRGALGDAEFVARNEALKLNYNRAEQALIRTLTEQVLQSGT